MEWLAQNWILVLVVFGVGAILLYSVRRAGHSAGGMGGRSAGNPQGMGSSSSHRHGGGCH